MERFCSKCEKLYDDSKRHDCPADKSLADLYNGTNDSGPSQEKPKSKPKQKPISRPVKETETDDRGEPEPMPTKPDKETKKAPQSGESLRDKQRGYARKWRENNPEAYRESQRRYRENNKEALRSKRREYMAAYRKRHQ